MQSPSNLLLAAALMLVAFSSFAQPVNDDCSGALLLSVGANPACDNPVAGTTVNATYSGADFCGFPYLDVWYKFVATAGAHTISISNARDTFNSGVYFALEVYSGDCSNLSHSFCSYARYSGGDVSFGDLTVGNTYFIRVVSPYNQAFNFDICLGTPPPPPANDACAGAVALDVDPDATCDTPLAGTTSGATTTPVPICNDCLAAFDDVWYSFTATQSNHIVSLSNIARDNNPSYANLGVFSGTCSALVYKSNAFFYDNGALLLTNLTPGENYYVRVFSNVNDPAPHTFNICVTSPPPPANDECAGAELAFVNPDLYCSSYFNGNTYLATSSGLDCEGGVSNDVWFQFVATSQAHHVQVYTYYGTGYGFEAYGGACGNLTSLGCASGYNPRVLLSDLTVGETYYLRMFSPPNSYFYFDGCITTLPPPPANDECSAAEPLPVNPDAGCALQTNCSTLGATSSAQNCSGQSATHDVWYSFVATAATHRLEVNQNVTFLGDYYNYGYEVLSGDCNNLNSITCKSFFNNYSPSILTGLTPGDTYFVRVYSDYGNAHGFSICVQTLPPPPANEECTTAEVLTPSPVSTCAVSVSGSTAGVLSDSDSYCYYGAGMDVWYSFTATSGTHILRVTDVQQLYGNYDYWVEVYEGADCNNLIYRECSTYPGAFYLNNLTAGQTYFIRWLSAPFSAHAFNICVGTLPTPANDECANAVTLPVDGDMNCDNATAGTTGGSTYIPSNTCFNSGDVWYSFTATQTSHQVSLNNVVDVENTNYQPISAELLANDCGDLISYYCYQGNIYGNGTLIFGDLIVGQTYYLRVGAYYGVPVNFNICVLTPPPPPANDVCAGAIELTPEPGNTCTAPTAGTTLDATPSLGVPLLCCGIGDVWYTFTVTQANHTITMSNVVNAQYNYYSEGATMEIYSSTCGSLVLEKQFNLYYSGTWTLTHLTPGQTYYVRVFGNYSPGINFDICITAPPPPVNDECANALPLPISEDLTCATILTTSTSGATQSLTACGGDPANDIWYQFTATTATYRFDPGIYGGYGAWGYEIFSGDCNGLTSIRCEQPYYLFPFVQDGFVIGEIYYLRLFSLQNNLVDLTLCTRPIPPPPANDECAGAFPLTVDVDLSCDATTQGTTLGATQSLSNCNGYPAQDVWYSFTATGVSHLLNIVPTVGYFGGLYDLGFQVLTGECGNLSTVLCQDYLYQSDFVLNNLTLDQTYYVRVYSQNNNAHDFTLCLMTLPPPPANDLCAQATPVQPNEGLTCDLTYPGTTLGATFGQEGYTPDVWFSFEATSNSHIFDLLNFNTVLGNPNALNFSVYQGSDCNALVFLANFSAGYTAQINYLQPGETYFVRVYPSDPNSAYTFDLCIKTLPPSPPNEECAGAFTLTPNAGLDCEIITPGSTAGAISTSYYSCGYGYDVWYQFTATAPNHWIQATNITPVLGNGAMWVEVLQSPDCANFNTLYCTYYDQTIYLTGLTTGDTYYVKVTSEYGTAHNYDLCIRTVPPPPNDLCANAIPLDVSAEQVCEAATGGTTTGSGPTPGISPCGFDGNDVWYSFTATQGSHTVLINNVLDAQYGYQSYFSAEVYGGVCGTLQNLACRNSLYFSDQFTVGDLEAGEVYYVRVFSYYYTGINFNICVGTPPPPPANDACANATDLPVSSGETCDAATSGTVQGATPSPGQPYYGYGIIYNDVWYTFTATQPNHIVTVNSDPNSFLVAEVLSGSCGAFSPVASKYLYYGNALLLTNLTPGDTYHIRIFEYGNQPVNFDICVTSIPTPPNDECAGATPLPVNPDLTCQQTVTAPSYGATQSLQSCYGSPVNDVWYQFVATGTSHRLNISTSGGNISYSFGMEVFEGNCAGLNVISPCADYYSGNATTILQNLVSGNTYYIRLYSFQGEFQTFTVCVQTLPPPPANDECAQAETIQANSGLTCDLIYYGSTLGATQSELSCYGYNTHDMWYQFTATSVSHLIELQQINSLLDLNGILGMKVYSGSDCGNLSTLQCFEYAPGNPMNLYGLTVGDTYYIRVFSQYNSAHEFSLCIKTLPPPPANDNCADALEVIPNEGLECTQPVAGSTAGITEYSYFGCNYGPDMWYQFTATSSVFLLQLQDVVNQFGYSYLSLELFQGNNCAALSLLACSYGNSQIYVTNLVPGSSYYIRVVGSQNSGMTFNLCVQAILPPANDMCAGATSLPVSSGANCESVVSGTTLGASQSNAPGVCTSMYADVWYSFVATGTAHEIEFSNISGGNYYELVYEVYSGNCGDLTSLGCYSAYSLNAFSNLTPGDTYYVKVGSYASSIFTFDLCVTLALPDLAPVYLSPNNGGCGPGNNETVQAVFYNQSALEIPTGASTFTLEVTGANSGSYGPLTNTYPIPAGLYAYVEFTGVDLSNPGISYITVTGTTTGDQNTANDQTSISFNGLPLQTFYYDVDGDGYGNPEIPITGCYQYEGLATNGNDCNDYNYYINPAAPEFCNGYDDDCDGLTDADDPGVIDTIAPGIICPPDTVLFNDPGQCSALVSYDAITAWDDCFYTLTQTSGIESGGAFPVGTTVNTYQVSDVANSTASCSFSVEVQKSGDPDLLYAYTVISFKELTIKQNTVQSGGVGVVNANKKATLQLNSLVTAPNTFVKAPVLDLQGGSQVTTYYAGQVAAGILPAFQPNNSPGNNNVTIPANGAPVTLALNNYGKITVGNNVTVTFSGHNTVRIKELAIGNGATILFAQPTTVLIDKKMDVGQNVDINPGGGQAVQFFAEDAVTIDKGADVSANIYTEKTLKLKKAAAGTPTYMNGLFIADKVESEEYVYWNWDETYCPAGGQNRGESDRAIEKPEVSQVLPGQLRLFPNPASDDVQVSFDWGTAGEATLQLFDATGRLARVEQFAIVEGANQYRLDLAGLPEGLYTVQIVSGERRAVEKLVVVKR